MQQRDFVLKVPLGFGRVEHSSIMMRNFRKGAVRRKRRRKCFSDTEAPPKALLFLQFKRKAEKLEDFTNVLSFHGPVGKLRGVTERDLFH